jgi:deazaflavin-dependent oxidoreductase (nitroreductase family)
MASKPWVYPEVTSSDRIFGRLMVLASRLGISIVGSRLLRVRGRSSGQWREAPVNPLPFEGHTYLVAPRGHVQWVRNLRAAGEGELQRGRRRRRFTARELTEAEKPTILRAYLRKWAFEVGRFFEGVGADASDEDLGRILPKHPVFEITLEDPK